MTVADPTTAPLSRHHVDTMLERARWAAGAFSDMPLDHVRRIVDAVADACVREARSLAEEAVRETGFGVVEHKALKNELCSRGVVDTYRHEDFCSHRIDEARKIVEVPRPAGVVFALTPSTNPVCTVFFKSLLALMTRNAVVVSPHPLAKRCSTRAAEIVAEAAERAGAPDGVVQVIPEPSVELIHHVMASPRINVTVATGGNPVVRAAYSSGNPALGVGPGNNPAYVDASADVAKAARDIVDSKSFDNSILCTNESAVLAHEGIADALMREMQRHGCAVVSDRDRDRLEEVLFPGGAFNTALVGKDAAVIAREAGIRVPDRTRVLLVPLERVGDDYPLSREKLCPVLGVLPVESLSAGISAARAMTRRHGGGHSAAIHAADADAILRFSAALPVLRVAVNAPCSTGAAGFQTHLPPTMTIGTGFFGRSSIGENLRPDHLVQWTKLAFDKDAAVRFPSFQGLDVTHAPREVDIMNGVGGTAPGGPGPGSPEHRAVEAAGRAVASHVQAGSGDDAMRDEIRRIIAEELRAALSGAGGR